MSDRSVYILYKNIRIQVYLGSNWTYIGNRIFNGLLAAKRDITKKLAYYGNDTDKVMQHYGILHEKGI